MTTTNLFSGREMHYAAGRPSYAIELINMLYDTIGFSASSVIADIGSGTGKFAEQLIKKGSTVICVEPNDDMRHQSEKELSPYSTVRFSNGNANETRLPDESVDFITAAQSFHWFDVSLFQQESRRILKPNGKAVLIWNLRDMSDELNQACFDVFTHYCPSFKGFGGGINRDDMRIQHYFNNQYNAVEFDNPLFFTKEKFINRCLSGSYSLTPVDEKYPEYIAKLNDIFNLFAKDNCVQTGNKTIAYIGQV